MIKACIDYIPTNTTNVYFSSGKCQQDKGHLLHKKNQICTPFSKIPRLIKPLLLSLFSPNFRFFTFFLQASRIREKKRKTHPLISPLVNLLGKWLCAKKNSLEIMNKHFIFRFLHRLPWSIFSKLIIAQKLRAVWRCQRLWTQDH